MFQLIEQLELPQLRHDERLRIVSQLRDALRVPPEHAPPKKKLFIMPSSYVVLFR